MNLHRAASKFDNAICTDAYNPSQAFLGQLDLFDDSKRDGVTVDRRILSVNPSVVMPVRNVIKIEGTTWLVGKRSIDTFRGKAIRHKYIIQECDTLGMLRSPKQFITGLGGVSVYSAALWIKDNKEVDTSSKLFNFMNVYFTKDEPAEVGKILTLGPQSFKLRNVYHAASGLQIAESTMMPKSCIVSIVYANTGAKVYNHLNDSYTDSSPLTLTGIFERFQDSYVYESASAPKYAIGDMLLTITRTDISNAKTGDYFTLLGDSWKVISSQGTDIDCWELQVRRA